ncbi:MAG: ABC transporter permease [Candidatus Saccharimonadales bacterium]
MKTGNNRLAFLPGRRHRYTAVRPEVLFAIAWKNLLAKKLRSLLTIFGVVIGIGAIFFLLSFGLGLQKLVTSQVIGDQSIKSIDVSSPNSKLIRLNDELINEIRNFPHVEKVGSQFSFPGSLKREGAEVDSVTYGIDVAFQEMTTLNLIAGRLLTSDDTRHVLINTTALEATGLKDNKKALGQKISITIPLEDLRLEQNEISGEFEIVGVIDSGSGSEIFMPSSNMYLAGVKTYQNVKIITDDPASVGQVRQQVESKGLETSSPVDTLAEINEIFRLFTFILIGFGSIGMIVSILGMFNTLTISLLERTREIGLMMALGARNSDMRKLFIFEAVLISFFGAIIGISLAAIAGRMVNFWMNRFASGRGVTDNFEIFSTPLWAVLALTGFTVIIGLLVVFLPARRAQRINPIEALRRE